ncbi:hypothetical protein AeRB84_008966 [Aphanomyces euteiches]|nr:hypothetical protein AeRB84_008966 [Aphanomyces euteiches]
MDTDPPTPAEEDTPLAMVTDPLVPDGDTPLDNMTAPLAPEVPPMAVAKVREPDAAAGLPPDKIETAPPVPVPLPPFTATLPPTPGVVSVVEPAEIDTMPPSHHVHQTLHRIQTSNRQSYQTSMYPC